MTLEEFIKQYYGSNSGLAKELSVSVQCVYDFKASRERMYRYLPQLKKHTVSTYRSQQRKKKR